MTPTRQFRQHHHCFILGATADDEDPAIGQRSTRTDKARPGRLIADLPGLG
jgi:hypothetical protein